jgi:hypothetical protein
MTLGEHIEQLVMLIRDSEPSAHERLRQVVGSRKARIGLDEQRVDVQFRDGSLHLEPSPPGEAADSEGITDRETVLDLLDGNLEASDAIRSGRIEIRGTPEDVDRIFVAIEILLDVATRTPSMQRLSERFRAEYPRRTPPATQARRTWYPFRCPPDEFELLDRLDLLPE